MLRYKFISLGEDEVDTASRRVASHERIQTEGIVLLVFKSLHEAEGQRRGEDTYLGEGQQNLSPWRQHVTSIGTREDNIHGLHRSNFTLLVLIDGRMELY